MSSTKPRAISVTPSFQDMEEIDAVVSSNSPWLTRYAVHQLALRVGLARLIEEPELAKELVAASRRDPNA